MRSFIKSIGIVFGIICLAYVTHESIPYMIPFGPPIIATILFYKWMTHVK